MKSIAPWNTILQLRLQKPSKKGYGRRSPSGFNMIQQLGRINPTSSENVDPVRQILYDHDRHEKNNFRSVFCCSVTVVTKEILVRRKTTMRALLQTLDGNHGPARQNELQCPLIRVDNQRLLWGKPLFGWCKCFPNGVLVDGWLIFGCVKLLNHILQS